MKKIENTFAVTGYVANDAQVNNFDTASVARFSIAVNRPEKKGEETTYTSAFMAIEAWRKNEAATAFDIIKKGALLTVKGYFKPEEWTDKETGQKRNRITMVAVEFYLAPDKVEEEKPAKASNKTKRTKKETSNVIVKTCSDICFTIGQKNCQMFVAKLHKFHHPHNRMRFYPAHSVLSFPDFAVDTFLPQRFLR